MKAKPPWTCPCECHSKREPAPLTDAVADLEERIRQRDGEWVDAIEDTLHFGIIPETLAGAVECMKAWLEEREARIDALESDLKLERAATLREAAEACGASDGWDMNPKDYSSLILALIPQADAHALDKFLAEAARPFADQLKQDCLAMARAEERILVLEAEVIAAYEESAVEVYEAYSRSNNGDVKLAASTAANNIRSLAALRTAAGKVAP